MAASKQNIMAWLSDQNMCAHDAILLKVRMPGVEPGSQAWEACMIPLHYMRLGIQVDAVLCLAAML